VTSWFLHTPASSAHANYLMVTTEHGEPEHQLQLVPLIVMLQMEGEILSSFRLVKLIRESVLVSGDRHSLFEQFKTFERTTWWW
jgi:hypothetical protein